MRQRVTMGYFVLDTTGIRRPMREDVIVEAETGDQAATIALAQHGPRLASLSGYGPDGMPRIGIIGIEPAGNDPVPEPALEGDKFESYVERESAVTVEPPKRGEVNAVIRAAKRGPGRPPKVRVNAV